MRERAEAKVMQLANTDSSSELLMQREIAREFPDVKGRYGLFGGAYVPETLVPALERLSSGITRWLHDTDFIAELNDQLAT